MMAGEMKLKKKDMNEKYNSRVVFLTELTLKLHYI